MNIIDYSQPTERYFGSKPKKVKPPPTPAPIPIQTEVAPQVQAKAKDERRRLLANRGRQGTVLSQDESKRSVLG
jgi:hypothetical protein